MKAQARSEAYLLEPQDESAASPRHHDRLLSKPVVKMLTGLENTGLHELQSPKSVYFDPTFPKARRRGQEFPPFWLESEIQAWIRNFGNNPPVNKKPKSGLQSKDARASAVNTGDGSADRFAGSPARVDHPG